MRGSRSLLREISLPDFFLETGFGAGVSGTASGIAGSSSGIRDVNGSVERTCRMHSSFSGMGSSDSIKLK